MLKTLSGQDNQPPPVFGALDPGRVLMSANRPVFGAGFDRRESHHIGRVVVCLWAPAGG